MPKLTKSILDAATPREKQFTIWCSELKGFGAFVHPSGSRTYFVDYRNRDGVRKRMTIGRHGTITAEQARKLAIATLGDAVKGEDPAEERVRRRMALTVKELCDRYLTAADKGLILGKGDRPKKRRALCMSIAGASTDILYRYLARSAYRLSNLLTSTNSLKTLRVENLQRSRRQARSVENP